MATKIKHTEYVDQPCSRCRSKQFIARKWKEKIPNYYSGFTEIECIQIECINKECEKEFISRQEEDAVKRENNRIKKEANDLSRKANALAAANKTRHSNKANI